MMYHCDMYCINLNPSGADNDVHFFSAQRIQISWETEGILRRAGGYHLCKRGEVAVKVRTYAVIITTTWRNNDVIIRSRVRWDVLQLVLVIIFQLILVTILIWMSAVMECISTRFSELWNIAPIFKGSSIRLHVLFQTCVCVFGHHRVHIFVRYM